MWAPQNIIQGFYDALLCRLTSSSVISRSSEIPREPGQRLLRYITRLRYGLEQVVRGVLPCASGRAPYLPCIMRLSSRDLTHSRRGGTEDAVSSYWDVLVTVVQGGKCVVKRGERQRNGRRPFRCSSQRRRGLRPFPSPTHLDFWNVVTPLRSLRPLSRPNPRTRQWSSKHIQPCYYNDSSELTLDRLARRKWVGYVGAVFTPKAKCNTEVILPRTCSPVLRIRGTTSAVASPKTPSSPLPTPSSTQVSKRWDTNVSHPPLKILLCM